MMGAIVKSSAVRLMLVLALASATAACSDQPSQRRGKKFYYAPDPVGGVWRGNAQTGELQHCVYTAGQDIACNDAPPPKSHKGKDADKGAPSPTN
jgi:hypothetical protein